MEIRFPIGDWSDDGHGKCDWFTVITAEGISVDDVREAHFKSKEILGFDLGSMCSKYCEDALKEEHVSKLKELGYDLDAILDVITEEGDYCPSPEELIRIWVFLLNVIDADLELMIKVENIPVFTFFGSDSTGHHLSGPGYGVFDV